MACISAPTAILAGGALSAGSNVVGGLMGSSAASDASKAQVDAANVAAQATKDIYGQVRTDLGPYREGGTNALNSLQTLLAPGGYLSTPIDTTSPVDTNWSPSIASLRATPGYQFTSQMGQRAVSNSMAAQGLGRSGAAGLAAGKYASGLAETTYQDQFSNWYNTQQLKLTNFLDQANLGLSQKQLIYNMLGGLTTTGEAAAAGTASAATTLNQTYGQDVLSAGASKAAGTVGSTNALTSGISGVSGAGSNTALLYALNQGGLFGSGGSGGGVTSNYNASGFDPALAGGDYGGGGGGGY